jgi:predicted transcriptional regulator
MKEAAKVARAAGGQGAERIGDGHSRADARMVQQAIRHKWIIPGSVYEKLPTELLEIFHTKKEGTRERLRAAEVIVKMHGQNEGDKNEINVTQQQGAVFQTTTLAELLARERAKIQSTYLPPAEPEAPTSERANPPPDNHASDNGKHP